MNPNHRLPPQVSALLCPLGSGLSLREPSLTFALGRGLWSSRETECCPVAPRSWVIGFLPWMDIAQLSPWSALSEMLVPGGPRVMERREGLRTGASWGSQMFPRKVSKPKRGCVVQGGVHRSIHFSCPKKTLCTLQAVQLSEPAEVWASYHWLQSHS